MYYVKCSIISSINSIDENSPVSYATRNFEEGGAKNGDRLQDILRCVGILGRRDVELDMFSQATILKKG